MNILVTGGAGYIGSHTVLALLQAGHQVVVLDNLGNGSTIALERVAELAGRAPAFVRGDIRDRALLLQLLQQYRIESVVHFAGLKAVGESVADPLRYYDNNVAGTLTLLQAMQEANVRQLVFSSSATVYGDPVFLPYTEQHPLAPTNPYGSTKLVVENMLRDLVGGAIAPMPPEKSKSVGAIAPPTERRAIGAIAPPTERRAIGAIAPPTRQSAPPTGGWRIALLRYFNPVGAHESGRIGEDPQGVPNNLMPFVAQVAIGRREKLQIFGGDYDTVDGTGVRDYIHVMDLADGHVRALDYLADNAGLLTVNLGTGHGVSVLEMVRAFEKASGRPIPYDIVARRPGDLPAYYADPATAEKLLGWKAMRDIDQMCADTWRWQSANPHGY